MRTYQPAPFYKLLVILLFGIFSTSMHAHNNSAYLHENPENFSPTIFFSNWMAYLNDDLLLSDVSIPGTHETMGYKNKEGLTDIALTQKLWLENQFKAGIRSIDLRFLHKKDQFIIYHGKRSLEFTFDYVMLKTIDFLKSHPGETVIINIMPATATAEKNTRKNFETFDALMTVNRDEVEGSFDVYTWSPRTDSSIPRLSEVRGKIVFMYKLWYLNGTERGQVRRRGLFANESNSSFIDRSETLDFNVQAKLYSNWEIIKERLSIIDAAEDDRFYTTSIVGSSLGAYPYFVASGHSRPATGAPRLPTGRTTPGWKSWKDFPRLNCFIGICTIAYEGLNTLTMNYIAASRPSFVGIITSDFPGTGLIEEIIHVNGSNFHGLPNQWYSWFQESGRGKGKGPGYSEFTCPDGLAITGREHQGDHNGATRYQCGPLRYTEHPVLVNTNEGIWSDQIQESGKREGRAQGYDCPDNTIMIGRKHEGNENGSTQYKCAPFIFAQDIQLKLEPGDWTAIVRESGKETGIGKSSFVCPDGQGMIGRIHKGDGNGYSRVRCAELVRD